MGTANAMEQALLAMLDRLMAGDYDPIDEIVAVERSRGFQVIRPGTAPWLPAADWKPATVVSVTPSRCARLVLLDAIEPGRGALTRTLAGLTLAGLTPAVIAPTRELAATLARRGWRACAVGSTLKDREMVWTPLRKHVDGEKMP
jgi:hypothetical protein